MILSIQQYNQNFNMIRLILICNLLGSTLVSFSQAVFNVPVNSPSNITNSTQLTIEFRIYQDSKLVNSGVLQPGEKSYCPAYHRFNPFQSPIMVQFKSVDLKYDLNTGTSDLIYMDGDWCTLIIDSKFLENCSWNIVIIHGIVIDLPTKMKTPKA